MHPLKSVGPSLWNLFNLTEFRNSERKYNSLFSFTALGTGGLEKRTWTQPSPPSMLTLHGRAYHRVFDLQQEHTSLDHTNVSHCARLYIYSSEFNMIQSLNVDLHTANTLRDHVHTKIKWVRQFRSAADDVINSHQTLHEPSSSAFIEFEQTSRVKKMARL